MVEGLFPTLVGGSLRLDRRRVESRPTRPASLTNLTSSMAIAFGPHLGIDHLAEGFFFFFMTNTPNAFGNAVI